jgi:hypothetical protein
MGESAGWFGERRASRCSPSSTSRLGRGLEHAGADHHQVVRWLEARAPTRTGPPRRSPRRQDDAVADGPIGTGFRR